MDPLPKTPSFRLDGTPRRDLRRLAAGSGLPSRRRSRRRARRCTSSPAPRAEVTGRRRAPGGRRTSCASPRARRDGPRCGARGVRKAAPRRPPGELGRHQPPQAGAGRGSTNDLDAIIDPQREGDVRAVPIGRRKADRGGTARGDHQHLLPDGPRRRLRTARSTAAPSTRSKASPRRWPWSSRRTASG